MERRKFSNGNEIVDFGITKSAVDVYRCLDRHLKKKNGVYPGNDTIAQECGISPIDVQSCIDQLHKIGFITEEPIS